MARVRRRPNPTTSPIREVAQNTALRHRLDAWQTRISGEGRQENPRDNQGIDPSAYELKLKVSDLHHVHDA